MPDFLKISKGTKATMPEEKEAGQLLIQTDTGNSFLDVSATERIQLKDDTKLPLTGGTLIDSTNSDKKIILNVNDPKITITDGTNNNNLGPGKIEVSNGTDSFILDVINTENISIPESVAKKIKDELHINADTLAEGLKAYFLPLTGGDMKGPITGGASGNAIDFVDGALKLTGVNTQVTIWEAGLGLKQNGDSPVTIYGVADPTMPEEAANKRYVDQEIAKVVSGGQVDASTLPFGVCTNAADDATKVISISGVTETINGYVQILFTQGYASGNAFSINGNTYSLIANPSKSLDPTGDNGIGVFYFSGSSADFLGWINTSSDIDDGQLQ